MKPEHSLALVSSIAGALTGAVVVSHHGSLVAAIVLALTIGALGALVAVLFRENSHC